MRLVSIFDLRNKLADYLSTVVDTDTPLVVRRFGKPIAIISPYKKDTAPASFTDYFGFLGPGETGTAFVRRVRRSPKEKIRTMKRRNRP